MRVKDIINLSFRDLEALNEILATSALVYDSKLQEATRNNYLAQIKRYKGRLTLIYELKKVIEEELKKLRAEKFESHRNSGKWQRAVNGTSNKLGQL